MKSKLKKAIKDLDPSIFGVKKISICSFKKLGIGEGNINYIFEINGGKFICRVNIDKHVPDKSEEEFNSLKIIEDLKVAPKAFYIHKRSKDFPYGFVIIEYIEGKALKCKKRSYTDTQINEIASLLGNLHSNKANLEKKNYLFKNYIEKAGHYIKEISKYNPLLETELKNITKQIRMNLPDENHEFGLIHGDICPQNIIEGKEGLKLIDWESLQYSDPAKDIANVLIDLELKGKNLSLFLGEYQSLRKDSRILERARIYAILFRYNYFLWEILRAYEIKNKELPEEYIKKTSAQSHINEAKLQFKKLKCLVNIPDFEWID